MQTGNILIANILPLILNLVFVLAFLRVVFIIGILLVLILAHGPRYKSAGLNSNVSDRISSFNTTEVNFNKLLTGFSKPFSFNKVY
jgi:hypothetical protein